jgi:hypothetical protein
LSSDLEAALPTLLPLAISWAEQQSHLSWTQGATLNERGVQLARSVGVRGPERVRIATVDAMPLPENTLLRAAAEQAGLLGPHLRGLTLGHTILWLRGQESHRLLSHELRHVHQYETAGSIAAYLGQYLVQIVKFGYVNAPFEIDARAYEIVP